MFLTVLTYADAVYSDYDTSTWEFVVKVYFKASRILACYIWEGDS